ncbi:MAG: A/G-specific adenine glycosylase [Anaerolineae bacterium]|nr:A/G-specific adenine glycosylase [Anaerolineae bacterium]
MFAIDQGSLPPAPGGRLPGLVSLWYSCAMHPHESKPFEAVAQALLDWYAHNARELPWRSDPQPYAVWVSEIMLQQTRMETVLPYYRRWMERFPSLVSLAQADLQEVLIHWEGLGYYSRARNLHKAAGVVLEQYAGMIPDTREGLEALPGIGRYTAAAIASIAFGRDEACLDGNIRRIYSRLFNVEEPLRSPAAETRLWTLAEQLLPPGRAGDFNQALMDLGSAVCTPQSPACLLCPLRSYCTACGLGVQAQRPVKTEKKPIPHKLVAAAIIERADGRILLAQRLPEGLFGGLWEFPGGKKEDGETLPEALAREIEEELDAAVAVGAEFGVYEHALTHFSLTLHAFRCRLADGREPRPVQASAVVWVTPAEMDAYPMGKIDRLIANGLRG